MTTEPSLTMGIEEEYLLVDRTTLDLAEAPQALMDDCVAEMGSQVAPEFLKCQVEIGTRVCQTIGEAREDLQTPALWRGRSRRALRTGALWPSVATPRRTGRTSTTPTRNATTCSSTIWAASRGGC